MAALVAVPSGLSTKLPYPRLMRCIYFTLLNSSYPDCQGPPPAPASQRPAPGSSRKRGGSRGRQEPASSALSDQLEGDECDSQEQPRTVIGSLSPKPLTILGDLTANKCLPG